eukprot:1609182-Pleurochrysis_carterae.AAC.4
MARRRWVKGVNRAASKQGRACPSSSAARALRTGLFAPMAKDVDDLCMAYLAGWHERGQARASRSCGVVEG